MGLPEKFTYPFSYAPHPLVREAAGQLVSRIDADPTLREIFAEGKMLGVLLATDANSETVCLYAFSGNVTVTDADGGRRTTNDLEGFVPPIYNLLDPDGHFKAKEAEISELNYSIYKAEKHPSQADSRDLEAMKARRRELSEYLQKWIFDQFVVLNALGESRSISDIFADKGLIPPGGTGECALPKLLQYAYLHGLKPRCFGEFWYGRSSGREVRTQGSFYPSCSGKCGVLLPYMLKGLAVDENPLAADFGSEWALEDNIVYEDDAIIAVNKPSGMLSVPGRGKEDAQGKAPASLLELLQRRANAKAGATPHQGPRIFAVHRLDMDTSGLIIYAKSAAAQASLRRQFEGGEVQKTYIARLVGTVDKQSEGRIELPLEADFFDRPRQIVDRENGKPAVTNYEVIGCKDGDSIVRFFPHTGRTHQLRVHSAHSEGLGHPIKGDRLYGGQDGNDSSGQLCLTAESIIFKHPESGESLSLCIPCRMD